MANIIRLKRRAAGGASGAPSSLKTTEPAYNEQDDTLYLGFGDDGSGNATSIRAVAGSGTFATKTYVDNAVGDAGGGDMMSATYDPQGIEADAFDRANHTGTQSADTITDGTTNKAFTAGEKTKLSGVETNADVTDAANVGAAIHGASAKTTPVNADTLPLIDSADSNALKKISYQNLASAVIAQIVDSAPGTLDTLNELAAALGDDPEFVTTITNALAAKAPLNSPALTGMPTAPTASASTNTTQIATTAMVQAAIAAATIDGGTF